MNIKHRIALISFLSVTFAPFAQIVPLADGKDRGPNAEEFFSRVESRLSCHDIYDSVMVSGERIVLENLDGRATSATLRQEAQRALESSRGRIKARVRPLPNQIRAEDLELLEQLQSLYRIFSEDVAAELRTQDLKSLDEQRAAFHRLFESESTPGDFAERLALGIGRLQERSNAVGIGCTDLSRFQQLNDDIRSAFDDPYQGYRFGDASSTQTLGGPTSTSHSRIVKGGHNAFSNLYQNCAVLNTEPVDGNLVIPGIVVTGNHPAGGKRRMVSKRNGLPVAEFYANHPYLKGFDAYYRDKGEAMGCFKLHENPPIYDFGGKPASSDGMIDQFTNAGSGTSVLGSDCSGFAVAAMLASGSRLKKDTANNIAQLVGNTSASALRNPKGNGLSCLSTFNIQKTDKALLTIQAGDFMASSGHVVLVEWVGADPFGLDAISSGKDCVSSKFDAKKFKIRILHSSPTNNGVGLAKHDLANYTNATYASAFKEIAVATCKAKFQSGFQGVSVTAAGVNGVRFTASSGCTESSKDFTKSRCVAACQNKEF